MAHAHPANSDFGGGGACSSSSGGHASPLGAAGRVSALRGGEDGLPADGGAPAMKVEYELAARPLVRVRFEFRTARARHALWLFRDSRCCSIGAGAVA